MSDPTLRLPFDQYQRYRLVSDILEGLRASGECLSVLDVGGRTALLRMFMPRDQVFLVDVEESPEEGLVLGTGSQLPFKDNSVDAVVTFDTLEHVPPAGRPAFLAECSRVARRWVVMAGPYDTEGVAHCEQMLTDFLRDKLGVEHRYLAEHASYGLPDLEVTEAALGAGGARVVSVGHANLQRWLTLMCAELYMDHDQALRGLAAKYYEFYNASMYASDYAAPVYRHAVVAAQGSASLPELDQRPASSEGPPGAFEPVAHVLAELLQFDIQRDVISKEWQRLEDVNGGLLRDLEGHQLSLSTLKKESDGRVLELDALNARTNQLICREEELLELSENRAEQLEWHKTELGRERRESDQTARLLRDNLQQAEQTEKTLRGRIEELESNTLALQEHTQGTTQRLDSANIALGDKQTALDQVQAELSHQQRVVEGLESNAHALQQHATDVTERLDQANLTLGEKQTALDMLRAELSHGRQIADGLRADLRDRWGNLLRALGLR